MNRLPIALVMIFAIVIIETTYNESFSSESIKRSSESTKRSTNSNSIENIITENATEKIYINPKFIKNIKHRGLNFQLSVLFPIVFFVLLFVLYIRCDRLRAFGMRPIQLGRFLRYIRS